MKVIDLLNKIANGEEVPKKIVIKNVELIYNEDLILNLQDCYYKSNVENATWDIWAYQLNDEVEILEEEKKIPEKLFFTHISNYNEQSVINNNFNNYFKKTKETINQLIDYLKSKGE